MIWELYQQSEIREAGRAADRAKRTSDRQASDLRDMEVQVNRMALACQAMWELTRDTVGLTEEHLEAKILEVDARDGRVDGKMGGQVLDCPACGRPTGSNRPVCVMCGAPVKRPHQFEG